MKKIVYFFFIFACFSCEEVIDLKLDNETPKLVIDAAIDWEKGESGQAQLIKLSYTSDYYDGNPSKKASGAVVSVTSSEGDVFLFQENMTEKGTYNCSHFVPRPNVTYTLSVTHNGIRYTSEDVMKEVPTITSANIIQRERGGFTGDKKELRLLFDTFPNEKNAFIIKINYLNNEKKKRDYIYAIDDEYLQQGKMVFIITGMDGDFEKDEELEFAVYRVSQAYKEYISLLRQNDVEQKGGGRNAFVTPMRVNGNVTNTSNVKENPLGGFRVAQYIKFQYKIQ